MLVLFGTDTLKEESETKHNRYTVTWRSKRVVTNATLSGNCHSFLRSEENKAELFLLLSEYMTKVEVKDKVLISTVNYEVVSSVPIDKCGIASCSHEEADTSILLHVCLMLSTVGSLV